MIRTFFEPCFVTKRPVIAQLVMDESLCLFKPSYLYAEGKKYTSVSRLKPPITVQYKIVFMIKLAYLKKLQV